ncbi:efflux RND transporter periplasmic adaptor subunit [Roseivirga pacifica]|uniref:efflux RND transporter periplasmic adaptor subunit n=1 Tax=Roseivirga pacifica TaxID=1267423 RepID=UPI003BA8F48E
MNKYLTLLLALFLSACGQDPVDSSVANAVETPAVSNTIWTSKTELFVEYPVLVVGKTSRFAAHFTLLDKHQPVREGSVTVSLIKGSTGIRHAVDAPSSPGIFSPALQPKESGDYQLIFDLKTPAYSDRIVVGNVKVYATLEDAVADAEAEDDSGISFLKEQAWKMEFQTAPVIEKEIYQTISTSGVWKVAPSDYQTLVAPNNGRVSFKLENLNDGMQVKKGQVLMTVSGTGLTNNNLSTEIQKAKAEYEQSSSAFERKKALYESKIVPKAELEQAEQAYLVAKANYETLSAGYVAGAKQVTAPFDGFVKSVQVANGGFAEQGTALLTVTSHKSSLLEIKVNPSYNAQLQQIQDIWYQPSEGVWSSLKANGGKILSVGKEVEADQPLISVFAEVNEGIEMPEGSFTEAQLSVGVPTRGVVVPVSCLMEDYGNYSVIVQVSGETFERRNVTLGKRNGEEAEITKGLASGEVVVTIGAYQVKMASMSGQAPAHGHAH